MKRIKASEILRRGLKLLNKGHNWGKGAFRQRKGNRVLYCAYEAVYTVEGRIRGPNARGNPYGASYWLGNSADRIYNDATETKWPQVRKWFKSAIKLAEKAEKENEKWIASKQSA